MKIQNFQKIVVLIFILFTLKTFAQEDKKTTFTIGTLYQNDMQYLGRKDSVATPLVVPNARLALKNGLFAELEGYYDTKQGKLSGGYGAVGYEFDKENWGGGISLSQYFFNSTSNLVKSSLGTSFGGYAYYNFGFITANIEPSYTFGSDGGLIVGTGFSKDIDIDDVGENGRIEISPKLYTWFGNENFSVAHIKKTKGKKATTTTTTTEKNKFQLMDIEANLPVSYVYNEKLKITAEPELAFPFNYKHLGGYYATNYPNPIFIFKLGASYTF